VFLATIPSIVIFYLLSYGKNKFDLIITDFGLPGLSGIDLTSKIRTFEKEKQIPLTPIIGLTAYREEKIKQACRQSGMNEVFTKPMTVELLSMIKKKYFPETFIDEQWYHRALARI
jgi:CheY-like chemotaxis protein